MPQRIEVPGMGVVEFPDGMTDEAIASAIKANMPRDKFAPDKISRPEALLIAAGRGTDKLVAGAKQLWHQGDQPKLDALAAEQQDKDETYAPLKKQYPFVTAVGEAAPSLAVPVAGPGGLVLRTAVAGALPGLAEYGSLQERLGRGAMGAAGGAVGGASAKVIARALHPAGVGVKGASKEAIAAAKRIGFQPTPGQLAQSPALQNFENYLARSPGSSGRMQRFSEANQAALNRAGAAAMGQQTDELSEAAFKAAETGIGSEFQRLQQITNPRLGNDFINALATVDSANMAKGPFASQQVRSLVDKGLDLATQGNLSGKAYKEIRTELSNAAQTAFRGGDATLGQAYKTVRKALDDAAKQSLSAADRKAWDTTRSQWAAFRTLADGNVAEAGNISAPRVASVLRRKGNDFRAGDMQGPLADIARIGEQFKGVSNPNSGQLMQQMMYGNPLSGLPLAAGNAAMAGLYMSPIGRAYAAGGLLDVGPAGELLMSKGGGLLGAPAVQSWLGAQ